MNPLGIMVWILVLLTLVLADYKPLEDNANYEATPGNLCAAICYCCELGKGLELPDDVTSCPPPFEREMDAYKRMTYGELKR